MITPAAAAAGVIMPQNLDIRELFLNL